jgi:pimeloyl-ACP methyl ester carboxylesterase
VGDPDGTPVLYFHGGGDSRLSRHPDDSIAASLGIRLLAVDRCGPAEPGRTLLSWGRDVGALADRLGLGGFAIVGWSAGGPHALATAAILGSRVAHVSVVAGMPPPSGLRTMPRDTRAAIRLARISPRLAAVRLERWARRPVAPIGDVDCDAAYAAGRVEAFRHGGLWLARELATLGRAWDFELADVSTPVTLWYGERDVVCPPSIGRAYEQALPDATLRVVDDGHRLLFTRWGEILAESASRSRVRRPQVALDKFAAGREGHDE